MLSKLLGINWRTTSAAVLAIIGLAGNIWIAWKAKDFTAIADNMHTIMLNLGLLATAFGLWSAKDKNVTGVGASAKAVDSSGTLTNKEGDVVGKQPAP